MYKSIATELLVNRTFMCHHTRWHCTQFSVPRAQGLPTQRLSYTLGTLQDANMTGSGTQPGRELISFISYKTPQSIQIFRISF